MSTRRKTYENKWEEYLRGGDKAWRVLRSSYRELRGHGIDSTGERYNQNDEQFGNRVRGQAGETFGKT